MDIFIGVEIGQRAEPSAICVAWAENREGSHGPALHYVVQFLERLAVGTSYTALADRVAEIVAKVPKYVAGNPYVFLYLNITSLGESVIDVFSRRVRDIRIVGVRFTHGDRRDVVSHQEIRLGKAYLVARLQTLLQEGCLHLPNIPDAKALAQDLLEFQIKVPEDANDRYGAFSVGARDDLVTALGLATQPIPPRSVYGPE